jgi:hypothetical protein
MHPLQRIRAQLSFYRWSSLTVGPKHVDEEIEG